MCAYIPETIKNVETKIKELTNQADKISIEKIQKELKNMQKKEI